MAGPEASPGHALPGVVVAGHLCLDIFPDLSSIPEGQFTRLFKPGHLVEAGPAGFAVGGAVSNTGLALARLGIPVRLIGMLGADPFADIVDRIFQRYARARIDEHGQPLLQTNFIIRPGTPTSYTVIISPPGVDRIFLHCTGANDAFVAGDVDFQTLESAALFHFGYPSLMGQFHLDGGRELIELFHRARQTGVTTSLDMTLPDASGGAGLADWVAILEAVLPDVDIFLPSIEEILFMLRRSMYDMLQDAASNVSLSPHLAHPSGMPFYGEQGLKEPTPEPSTLPFGSAIREVRPQGERERGLGGGEPNANPPQTGVPEGGGSLVQRVTPELLDDLSSQLLEMGVKIAGFKLGERGFYLRTASKKVLEKLGRGRPADLDAWACQTLWAPAFKVKVAGTTGAGDSAIAGLLSGLLRGLGPRQALSAAVGVGACNVEAADGQSGLRSWEDTLARIATGWERHDLDLSPAGWTWDAESGVWLAPILRGQAPNMRGQAPKMRGQGNA